MNYHDFEKVLIVFVQIRYRKEWLAGPVTTMVSGKRDGGARCISSKNRDFSRKMRYFPYPFRPMRHGEAGTLILKEKNREQRFLRGL